MHAAACKISAKESKATRRSVVYVMEAKVMFEIPVAEETAGSASEQEIFQQNAGTAVEAVKKMFESTQGVFRVDEHFPGTSAAFIFVQGAESVDEDGGEEMLSLIEPYIIKVTE